MGRATPFRPGGRTAPVVKPGVDLYAAVEFHPPMISGEPQTMKRLRVDWIVLITAVLLAASGCGGGCGGCSTFEPIPGGFPSAKRNPNAVQVRVSQSGLA